MRAIRKGKHGIPVVSRHEIEWRTSNFISKFCPECLERPTFTPIAGIATALQERGYVRFDFNSDLGEFKGRKIRGSFGLKSRVIQVDRGIPPGTPGFNFTLAHEIGHFVMHRDISPEAVGIENDTIGDGDRELVLEMQAPGRPRSWIEWQANKFAASLLMPLETFPTAVRVVQGEIGITKNIGTVFQYRDPMLDADYNATVNRLGAVYQVSRSATRVRLRELGMLNENSSRGGRRGGPRHILDVF